jgi:hypothetical protein
MALKSINILQLTLNLLCQSGGHYHKLLIVHLLHMYVHRIVHMCHYCYGLSTMKNKTNNFSHRVLQSRYSTNKLFLAERDLQKSWVEFHSDPKSILKHFYASNIWFQSEENCQCWAKVFAFRLHNISFYIFIFRESIFLKDEHDHIFSCTWNIFFFQKHTQQYIYVFLKYLWRVQTDRWSSPNEPGVDVKITIFCDFSQFSEKQLSFFSKYQCYDQLFCIIYVCFESKTPIFSQNVSAKIFKKL